MDKIQCPKCNEQITIIKTPYPNAGKPANTWEVMPCGCMVSAIADRAQAVAIWNAHLAYLRSIGYAMQLPDGCDLSDDAEPLSQDDRGYGY